MAAICSVCAEPFTRHVQQFGQALAELGPSAATVMTDYDVLVVGRRHRRHGVRPEARRHGLPRPAGREGGQRRREDDPAQQGLPDPRLRELHLDPEDGGLDPPPQRDDAHLQRGRGDRAGRRGAVPGARSSRRRGSSTRRPAPAARSARRPAPSPCPTSSTPTWWPATRPTSPSPRRCPRRRSSSEPARRRARSPARPASRPTATSRSSGAASTRRPSSSCSTRRPLVGTLGRACYAPCEVDCTRGSLEGPLPIRRLKRFIADEHYDRFDGPGVEIPEPNGHRVAIVGSGPAGLTAAWQLARKGYAVKIFEAAPKAGGFLRLRDPRLPAPVGGGRARHRQRHRARRRDRRRHAGRGPRGAPRRRLRRRPGRDRARRSRPGWACPATSSTASSAGSPSSGPRSSARASTWRDRRVVVIGGGNVAMDTARTARRLGARDVTVVYRRTRAEMPAHHVEADDTEKEGVGFVFQARPGRRPRRRPRGDPRAALQADDARAPRTPPAEADRSRSRAASSRSTAT